MEILTKNMALYKDQPVLRDEKNPEGITYGQLDQMSGRVYGWLKKEGIGREKIVMIHMPRGAEAFVAAIGVLRAGAAYTLTEAGYPKERIEFIEKDCSCVLRIDNSIYEEMMSYPAETGYEPELEHDAAYAVYTSGTTGNPKGVLHERGQLSLFLQSAQDDEGPFCIPGDRFMLLSPMNFVASTLLLLLTSGNGGQLIIADYNTVRNPAELRSFMETHRITGGFMTPSLVRAFAGGQNTVGNCHPFNPDFRVLILSSEPARNIFYQNLKILNVFAQSEMGFLGGVFRVNEPWEITPVGHCMIPGMTITLQDVSAGMGEVCIQNPYFRGYINLPEMTEYVLRDGIYHTGDIGKATGHEGDIILLGRNDDMVKINGNRVEPAEIEAAAKQIMGVSWCAARAFITPERAYICVYYQDDIQVDEEAVIRIMAERLPAYMVPSCLMKIDRIPLNANGKMNRKALPEPDILRRETVYIAPKTEKEAKICRAFARVLSLSRVGVTDDFYRIGGDSLKTIRLMSEDGMQGISATDVFRERTPQALAVMLDGREENPEESEQIMERERKARRKEFSLTPVQQDFFDIQARHPESLMWVLPVLYAFPIQDEEKLYEAAEIMIHNHPVFCTILLQKQNGKVVQAYRPEILRPVSIETGTEEEIMEIRKTLKDPDLPFHILDNPLAKVRLIRTDKHIYLYMLIHHVMTDGMGIRAMLNTLRTAFAGGEPIPDVYYSWLESEERTIGGPAWEKAREAMESLYSGTEWTGQIPSNGSEPGEENSVVGSFIPMTEDSMQALEQEARVSRTGLYAAIIMLALARQTGKRDIMINWVFSNRGNTKLDGISGMMIRSLALGIHFDQMKTLGDVYREIREQMLENIANSAYEWCLYHPLGAGKDRLFFIYEGGITGFDVLQDIGGEMVPLMMNNQAVVHPMSAQVLDWTKNGEKGMLLACYCNRKMFNETETAKFRTILKETAELVLKIPNSRTQTVKSVIE